jgi:hypothetical protein
MCAGTTVSDLSSQAIAQMRSPEVDEALQYLLADEKRIRTVRRELMNRKAFLNAEIYVVVTVDRTSVLCGIAKDLDVQMPEFGLSIKTSDKQALICLSREDKMMCFSCHGRLEFKEVPLFAEEDSEKAKSERSFEFEVFSALTDAQGFLSETQNALL